MTESSAPPAGWHPDPTGQFEQRYWDGGKWTEHVHSAGVQSVSALPGAAGAAAQQGAQPADQQVAQQAAQEAERQAAERQEAERQAAERQAAEQAALQATQQAEQQQADQLAAQRAAEAASGQPSQQSQPTQGAGAPAAAGPAAGWHPDPTGQFEQRYWDGSQWTEHVSHQGQQGVSPLTAPRTVQTSSPEQVQRQVQTQARIAPSAVGGGHLMDEPILVVNQKAKLIEITAEFAVYDQAGRQLGSVIEVGQSKARKVLRFATSVDQFLTHKFEIRDAQHAVLMTLVRPAKLMKSKVIVGTPSGQEIGTIRQENVLGKIRFAFEVGGERVGGIQAENWRAWNFSVVDAAGTEIARITKTWEGLAKAAFTTADNYVVQIHQRLPEPLRSMVIASALTVDTALKQDSN